MNKCRRFSGGPAKQGELLISSDVQSGSLTRRGAEQVMFLPNIGIFSTAFAFPQAGRERWELC